MNSKLKTTIQIAFPDDISSAVYKTALYSAHGQNTSADMIFSDSLSAEPATVTLNASNGYDLVHHIYVAG